MHSQVTQMLESFLDKPAFSQSQLIKILLKHSEAISLTNKEYFLDALVSYYHFYPFNPKFMELGLNSFEKPKFSPNKNPAENDYRIKSIRASNFRGVPKQSDAVPYGIDFCTEKDPRSTIILGENGSGKSSIFSGMEMIYTHKISEKILRTNYSPTDEEFIKYYERVPLSQEPQFEICTKENTYTLNKPLNPESEEYENRLDNYFISENDIITIGKLDFQDDKNSPNSFASFIARSLGYSKIVEFYEYIMIVNQYRRRKEMIEHNMRETQEKELKNGIEKLKKEVDIKENELKTLMENDERALSDPSNFNSCITALKMIDVPFDINPQEVVSTRNKFMDVFFKFIIPDNREIPKKKFDFFSLGIELFKTHENCPFCGDSKKNKSEIIEDVTNYMKDIKYHYNLFEDLEVAQEEIFDFWKKLDLALIKLCEMLEDEINAISGEKKLNKLYDDEKSLIEFISRELLITEYWGQIKEILNNTFIGDKDSQVFQILSKEKETTILRLIQEISDFKQKRSKILDAALKTVLDGGIILQKVNLIDEIETLKSRRDESIEELKKKKIERRQTQVKINRLKNIKEELKGLEREISIYLEEIIDEPFTKIEPIVLEIMGDYLSTRDSEVELIIEKRQRYSSEKGGLSEIYYYTSLLSIKDGEGAIEVTPDKFFNSFRYNLFCLMLKIATTIAYRVQNKQNFPLIVDDLFSSSDYENRNNFAKFIKKVIELFDKYSKDLPLQLIIFTHDSLIFRSVMDALYNIDLPNFSKPKFGKLFAPEDRDERESVDSDGNKFWNLVRFINEPSPVKADIR